MLVPVAEVPQASKIFQALDPDTGGIYSFGPPDKKGMCYASMPCTEEDALHFDKMMAEPAELEAYIEADYEKRWKPTEEVIAAATKDPKLAEQIRKVNYSKLEAMKAVADITTVDKETILAKRDPVITVADTDIKVIEELPPVKGGK